MLTKIHNPHPRLKYFDITMEPEEEHIFPEGAEGGSVGSVFLYGGPKPQHRDFRPRARWSLGLGAYTAAPQGDRWLCFATSMNIEKVNVVGSREVPPGVEIVVAWTQDPLIVVGDEEAASGDWFPGSTEVGQWVFGDCDLVLLS